MRRTIAAAALTLALVGVSSGAALAADDYTPDTPKTPTLAGSSASGSCTENTPRIDYSVTLTDPDGQATSRTAYLRLSDGSQSMDLKLGQLVDNKLSGTVAWPDAAWTRGNISAVIDVDTQLPVALSYPKDCATALSAEGPDSGSVLATTGGTVSLAAAGVGVAALAVGLGLTLRRRRAQR